MVKQSKPPKALPFRESIQKGNSHHGCFILTIMRLVATLLMEKPVARHDCCGYASGIGNQGAGDSVANMADTNAAKINSEHIKGGFSTSLQDGCQGGGEGIDAVGAHGLQHHSACTAAAEGFHQGCGQGLNEVGVEVEQREHVFNTD